MSEARWSGEWHIVDTRTGESLESHIRENAAQYFCKAVNDHETSNGRLPVYVVERHPIAWRRA